MKTETVWIFQQPNGALSAKNQTDPTCAHPVTSSLVGLEPITCEENPKGSYFHDNCNLFLFFSFDDVL